MATANRLERATETCEWPGVEAIEENLRDVRRAATAARHAAEDTVAETALQIRRHPLRAVGAALVGGVGVGALAGFGAGWIARARR